MFKSKSSSNSLQIGGHLKVSIESKQEMKYKKTTYFFLVTLFLSRPGVGRSLKHLGRFEFRIEL